MLAGKVTTEVWTVNLVHATLALVILINVPNFEQIHRNIHFTNLQILFMILGLNLSAAW